MANHVTHAGMGRSFVEATLRPYAQIVFSRDLFVGLLVLAAISAFPRVAVASLLAAWIAAGVSLLLGLGGATTREGSAGCTAVLTTLALVTFSPDRGGWLGLVAVTALLSVLITASSESWLAGVGLPPHSLPFVLTTWTVHLAARSLSPSGDGMHELLSPSLFPTILHGPWWLDIPASILFLHGAVAGLLVLFAIAVHSRISLLLAFVGMGTSMAARPFFRVDMPWSVIDITASFNAVLAAMALGGIWFVPQPSSVALAAASSFVVCIVSYAAFPFLSLASLPVLSLPFVLVVHLVLTASRRRTHDRWPRSVIPTGRPEESLARHLMRIRRFGNVAWLPFRLPFRGEWFVSQGYEGAHTHKELWKHGLDFEGRNASNRAAERMGKELRDYVCYGLPVVAAGSGTVVHVVDNIPDNRPGEVNTRDNWGNAVVVFHGLGLYSVYAHLQPNNIRVKTGTSVTSGDEIGRCGNSGRSATPHLHFQVQRAAALGSPTVAADFGDVVTRRGDEFELGTRMLPAEGALVRPIVRDELLAKALAFQPGTVFELREEGTDRRERAEVEIDLSGNRTLRSDRARLFLDPYDGGLVIIDFYGRLDSLLRYLLLCLARVPFDQAPNIMWSDALSRRFFAPPTLRFLADILPVVVPDAGSVEVRYSMKREEGKTIVRGQSVSWSTTAMISLAGDQHRFELERSGRKTAITMRQVGSNEDEGRP